MQEVDLINQDELDKNRTILNNEFEQLIQNDFISNTMVIPLVNWITKFLNFLDELKDENTYIKKIVEYEIFIIQTIEKYPFYQNPNLFDPKSLFSEIELDTWEKANAYYKNFQIQKNKLDDLADELILDFYGNKLKKFDSVSNELLALLKLKKLINKKKSLYDDIIIFLEEIAIKSSENTKSNPYPKIFVNDSAYSLFLELIEELKNDRPNKKLIKEDVSFIIDKLKNEQNKVNAIKFNVKLLVLCEFFSQFESTQHLGFESKNIKYNRDNKRLNDIFNSIVIKYNPPFIAKNEQ